METITEEIVHAPTPQEEITAEQKSAAFGTSLNQHVQAFENIVNKLPSTEAAILFCGAIEKVAFDFKEIFKSSLEEQLKNDELHVHSKGMIRRKLLELEQCSRTLMRAQQIKAS